MAAILSPREAGRNKKGPAGSRPRECANVQAECELLLVLSIAATVTAIATFAVAVIIIIVIAGLAVVVGVPWMLTSMASAVPAPVGVALT